MTSREEKARRMELRRKSRTRTVCPPQPRPYLRGPKYLMANVCFVCRVGFKRPVVVEGAKHKCPNCGGEAHEMGRYFRMPRKGDAKQWEKVRRLWAAGYRFYMSTCDNAYPDRLSEVDAFIRANPRHQNRLRSFWPRG